MKSPIFLALLVATIALVSGVAAWSQPSGSIQQVIEELTRLAAATKRDDAWADAVALNAGELIDAGYNYRAAEWAVALSAGRGVADPRAPELIDRISPRALSDEELLYLGYLADRGGRPAAATLLSLARLAHDDRRAVTPILLAGARAAGADSQAVVAVGAGWPPARRLGFFTVGLLAPVNGRLARQGESMVRGAQLAIDEWNRGARFPLKIEVGDTRGDPLVAARAVNELLAAGVGALAGDIILATTLPAAAAAEAAGVPLVSPASGRDDLASIGPHVFQSIPTREVQAAAVARAAVRDLRLKRLATLEPNTPQGKAIASRFAAEAKRLGADVVERLVYRSGETNFSDLGRLAQLAPEGILVCGTARELMSAIPQFAYYEVGGKVLGVEDLGMKEVIEATAEFLDGAVFADSYYLVPASSGGESFTQRYTRRFKTEPDAQASRGYVVARLLATTIAGGARSPAAIRASLARQSLAGTGIIAVAEDVGEVALFRLSKKGAAEPMHLAPNVE
jgi:branched-chain amino acid transport system substrate-binding protein